MPNGLRVEVTRPRAGRVRLRDNRPREIVITLDTGVRIELHPEERDQGAQLRWVDAAMTALQQARALLADPHAHAEQPPPGESTDTAPAPTRAHGS